MYCLDADDVAIGVYVLKSVRGKGKESTCSSMPARCKLRKHRELTKLSITTSKQVYFKFKLFLLRYQVHTK